MPGLLFAAVAAVLRCTSVWSWWALLWVPLLLLGVVVTVQEWRLSARKRWRIGVMEWLSLVLANTSLAVCLTAVWVLG
ncbi:MULTISPECIES: hypothetical protein [Streptomyces]|uniref:hypothetical protein n=1 Tax=Streptomyces TaxID=1883 RepID=UPI0016794101|nr:MULTISPECIES: hypothetical protein [Streptomyces]MBD3575460.1 hypothetical protein [Streptomyces sp. KD18]GGS93438.1 hypothetical protein GCM10010286_17830 [Streptomyces toxytricini]